jgi:hypothetical protein
MTTSPPDGPATPDPNQQADPFTQQLPQEQQPVPGQAPYAPPMPEQDPLIPPVPQQPPDPRYGAYAPRQPVPNNPYAQPIPPAQAPYVPPIPQQDPLIPPVPQQPPLVPPVPQQAPDPQYGPYAPPQPQQVVPNNPYAQPIPAMPQAAPDQQWGPPVPQMPDLRSRLSEALGEHLSASEIQAAERAIRVFEALGPVFNAVERARELLRPLNDMYQQTRGAVVDASRRAVIATRKAADTASERTTAENGRAVLNGMANAGRAALRTGQQLYDGVSRWARGMQSTGARRAETTRRTFMLFRQQPSLTQTNLHGKDVNSLASRAFAVEHAQTPAERTEALEQLYQSAKSLQTEEGAGRHRGGSDLSAGQAASLQARVIAVESAQTPEARAEALGHLYDTAASLTAQPGTGQHRGAAESTGLAPSNNPAQPGTGRHRGGPGTANLTAWVNEGQLPAGSGRSDPNSHGEAQKTGGQLTQGQNQNQGFTK